MDDNKTENTKPVTVKDMIDCLEGFPGDWPVRFADEGDKYFTCTFMVNAEGQKLCQIQLKEVV